MTAAELARHLREDAACYRECPEPCMRFMGALVVAIEGRTLADFCDALARIIERGGDAWQGGSPGASAARSRRS